MPWVCERTEDGKAHGMENMPRLLAAREKPRQGRQKMAHGPASRDGFTSAPSPPLPPSPASAGEGDAIGRGSIAPGLPIKSIGTGHALGYTLSALRAWQNELRALVTLTRSSDASADGKRVAQVPFSGPAALLCLCPGPTGAESRRKRPAKAAIRQLTDGSCAICDLLSQAPP
jgi:hypothetical protein